MIIKNRLQTSCYFPYAGSKNRGVELGPGENSPEVPYDRIYLSVVRRDWEAGRIELYLSKEEQQLYGKMHKLEVEKSGPLAGYARICRPILSKIEPYNESISIVDENTSIVDNTSESNTNSEIASSTTNKKMLEAFSILETPIDKIPISNEKDVTLPKNYITDETIVETNKEEDKNCQNTEQIKTSKRGRKSKNQVENE